MLTTITNSEGEILTEIGQPEPNATDDLEPFVGVYDWDRAIEQNPGEPVDEVPGSVRARRFGSE